jgi:hypothetical protein
MQMVNTGEWIRTTDTREGMGVIDPLLLPLSYTSLIGGSNVGNSSGTL